MPITLDQLPLGAEAYIVRVKGEGALRVRLLDMGLTPRAHVRLINVAPMGDPLELKVRGYILSIRKEDARRIEVESVVEEATPRAARVGQSSVAESGPSDEQRAIIP